MIKIVTDSACDLPDAIVSAHGITVVPLYINFGQESYLDGEELSRREFYQRLGNGAALPTTAVPGPDRFRRVYKRLADEGATEILSIHVSPSLSSLLNVAQVAARETETVSVRVFDSRQLSLGMGCLVLAAAKAAAEGRAMDDVVATLEEQISRTYVFAALDTLEFLRRSGRMNSVVAGLGSVLRIKPLLKMHDGNPTSERVRTRGRAMRRLIDLVSDLGPLEKLAMVHTNAYPEAEALRQQAQHLFPSGDEPMYAEVTPVIGAHIGPGAVGFTCIKAPRS